MTTHFSEITCTIITIGDEILIGQIVDTNSAYIAQKLAKLGVTVREILSITDTEEAILQALTESSSLSQIIITTGGLGPTQDDKTKKTYAHYFQTDLVRDEQTYEHVKQFFETRNRPFTAVNEAQADVPRNAQVLFNKRGTAPGMEFYERGVLYFALPGVPFEMKYLLDTYVLNHIEEKFQLPSLYYAHIQTFGIGESFLADRIKSLEDALPKYISMSYLPSPYLVNIRLSSISSHREEVDRIASQIKSQVQDHVYGETEETIDQVFHQFMLNSGLKLCTIESCTGGFLANTITNHSGSSTYFNGSWTVYTNEFKESQLDIPAETLQEFGAVSEICARQLLINGLKKSKSDVGIAIVGYLEKDEGISPHAFIAYGSESLFKIEKIDLFYPREIAKVGLKNLAFCKLYMMMKGGVI